VESVVQHDKAISKLAYNILSLCGVHCCLAKGIPHNIHTHVAACHMRHLV
jgi:uncharacterized membrane protein YuzA (DUF378 family)